MKQILFSGGTLITSTLLVVCFTTDTFLVLNLLTLFYFLTVIAKKI